MKSAEMKKKIVEYLQRICIKLGFAIQVKRADYGEFQHVTCFCTSCAMCNSKTFVCNCKGIVIEEDKSCGCFVDGKKNRAEFPA